MAAQETHIPPILEKGREMEKSAGRSAMKNPLDLKSTMQRNGKQKGEMEAGGESRRKSKTEKMVGEEKGLIFPASSSVKWG